MPRRFTEPGNVLKLERSLYGRKQSPRGFAEPVNVLKLKRSLYGLKQSLLENEKRNNETNEHKIKENIENYRCG